ncbi:MAG: flavin reductase family protein [SAR324 cluster bacterium]|nr:flavin reductase family protein [SAR324 cluster bacterium]
MNFDTKLLRQAFGQFATGIAVVTVQTQTGKKLGLTINSFSSVSLDPPLLLFSLDKKSRVFDAFLKASAIGISVLNEHQQSVSDNFAKQHETGLENSFSLKTGAPLLMESLANFDCEVRFHYEGGDHIIFVGEIIDFKKNEGKPLLYFSGKYHTI